MDLTNHKIIIELITNYSIIDQLNLSYFLSFSNSVSWIICGFIKFSKSGTSSTNPYVRYIKFSLIRDKFKKT